MLLRAADVPNDSTLTADVCVIGAGPAGLALAAELDTSPYRTILLERGPLAAGREHAPCPPLDFESPDFDSPEGARCCRVGGTAAVWDVPLARGAPGARYVRLDPIDFERREFVPHSGWPFGRERLEPFYERAEALCGLEPDAHLTAAARAELLELPGDTLRTELDRFGPRAVFAEQIPRRLALSCRTTALVEAPAWSLRARRARGAVELALAGRGAGAMFAIRARVFVLAAGAIETARLLLIAGRDPEARLVIPDGAGRFFMDHHYVLAGTFTPPDPRVFNRARLYDLRRLGGTFTMGKLRPTESVMRQRRLLSGSARLEPELRPECVAATRSAATLVRGVLQGRIPGSVVTHLGRIVPCLGYLVSAGLGLGVRQRSLTPALCPGWSRLVGKHRHFTAFRVVLQTEQAPNPDNRVVLSDRTDVVGRPIARLRAGWSAVDLESLSGIQAVLVDGFARAGWGRLDKPVAGRPVLVDRRGAHHHLGTTRMHPDPRLGVVDESCRVHDVPNLFVAGGSLFPTGGSANPTLTIVALALRLADHLRSLLRA